MKWEQNLNGTDWNIGFIVVELNGNATNVANLKWCDSGGNDSNDYDDNIDGVWDQRLYYLWSANFWKPI